MTQRHYEDAPEYDSAYTVEGYRGIAWRIWGWQTEPDADTVWTGMENRTGQLVCVMVGDDRAFLFDPDELTPLDELAYCGSCGQVGCTHGGH